MVVLDAWPILALYEDLPCAGRVAEALDGGVAMTSALNLGEVLYRLERRVGRRRALALVADVRGRCRVEYPTSGSIARVAAIKARGGLSYADAFCVDLATHHRLALWTGDPEILAFDDPRLETVDLR